MRPRDCVRCDTFPCRDVRHECYFVPDIDVDPAAISIVLISEAAPAESADHYYAAGNPFFAQTTTQVFREAGAPVTSIRDILNLGVYLTTAVKCGKTGYGIAGSTIKECSRILKAELDLFPNLQAILLMGDVAIKGFNHMSLAAGDGRVIPAGPTYKIRKQEFRWRGSRVFPSYLQAGPSFFIEKGKHSVISADIAAALALVR